MSKKYMVLIFAGALLLGLGGGVVSHFLFKERDQTKDLLTLILEVTDLRAEVKALEKKFDNFVKELQESTGAASEISQEGTPTPGTAEEAIAMVRASPKMSEAVAPFRKELDWKAEWVGDRWYVIGLFESPWGVRFVQDATVKDGQVYAYIDYKERPPREWVAAKAREWGLTTLYTRLTPEAALELVQESSSVSNALDEVEKVIDAEANLVEDTAAHQRWLFAFYVQRKDGKKAILVVGGSGLWEGVEEGRYGGHYGFGEAPEASWEIPLHLRDWIQSLADTRNWADAFNLPSKEER